MITAQDDDSPLREGGFDETADLLDLLLWSGPTSMIPTRDAVMKWRATLADRGPEFASLVSECDEWLKPDERAQGMKYSYEITPRPAELGGGWRLRLLEDSEEVGGGVFPIVQDDPQAGVTWWNGCTEPERAHWLAVAKSAVPADAWTAYQLAETHADAEDTAYDWLDSRESA